MAKGKICVLAFIMIILTNITLCYADQFNTVVIGNPTVDPVGTWTGTTGVYTHTELSSGISNTTREITSIEVTVSETSNANIYLSQFIFTFTDGSHGHGALYGVYGNSKIYVETSSVDTDSGKYRALTRRGTLSFQSSIGTGSSDTLDLIFYASYHYMGYSSWTGGATDIYLANGLTKQSESANKTEMDNFENQPRIIQDSDR